MTPLQIRFRQVPCRGIAPALSYLKIILPLFACLCGSAFAQVGQRPSADENTLSGSLFDTARYQQYMTDQIDAPNQLVDAYDLAQYQLLPVVSPDPDFLHVEDGVIIPFDPEILPRQFVRRLTRNSLADFG